MEPFGIFQGLRSLRFDSGEASEADRLYRTILVVHTGESASTFNACKFAHRLYARMR
jgi:hypothetical protein